MQVDKIILAYILFTLGLIIDTQAQKLPTVQKESLRAPTNIKIDGKADEWGDKFEAYNHATDLYYSITNDDDNLYLIFQCSDADALTKIMKNGINFSINTASKAGIASVTFPYYPNGNPININFAKNPKVVPSSAISIAEADSLMKDYNVRLNNKLKYIKVSGVSGIDSAISIYNENGIKVKGAFNSNLAYNYELAFPLKYLGFTVDNPDLLKYHVILNGLTLAERGIAVTKDAEGRVLSIRVTGNVGAPLSRDHFMSESATTDFRGEYTLAKSNK